MHRLCYALLLAGLLAGCTKPERHVIKADRAQIGSDATITLDGTKGTLTMGKWPGYPQGINEPVEDLSNVAERNAPVGYRTMRILVPAWKRELTFSVVGAQYICVFGCTGTLPLTWHKE